MQSERNRYLGIKATLEKRRRVNQEFDHYAYSLAMSMITSTTLPPPTINALGPSQRARLLRSTRKLENLLGAIPQVVEPGLPSRNATLHEKSKSQNVYVSSPTASPVLSSINSAECPEFSRLVPAASRSSQITIARKHKSVPLPRPLLLHPNNVSAVIKPNVRIEHSDSAQVLTLPPPAFSTPSPLSPLFASEDEPMSPTQVPQEKIRRKRMAKLTRTLGENIPTEFILPHDRLKLIQHQRSPSEPSARSLWPDWERKESEAMSVVANNTTLPPPTINSLGPSQRARLLKSTRKLENLLGATPQVEESAVLPPATTNSTHIAFPVSSADSPESLEQVSTSLRLSQNEPAEKHSKHKSVHLPRPLVLRHNSASAVTKLNVRIEHPSSTDSVQVLTLPHTTIVTPSPLSPLFATEDEPMSPMDVPQEKIRRMRMAKLTRTLGENIPTEFILRHDHLKLSQHQRSPSEPSPRSLWPDWRKKESEDNDPTVTHATAVPSHRSKPAIIRKLRRRPMSIGPEVVLSSALFTATSSSLEGPSSPVNPSDSETTEDNDVDVIGSDWRGEWNIKDAQERAMALRNLRGH